MTSESQGASEGAEYLDVLLLCAAPLDVRPALNLAVEVANFAAEVRRSPVPIRLRRVFPPTFDQLRRELAPTALKGRAPRVFHFLGHGEEDSLWFEDEEGGGDRITAARLRKVFEGTPIRLALLNACWSATPWMKNLCSHLVEDAGLTAAIGHGKPIADASGIAFARRFYAEVVRGESVHRAYFAARNALAEQGLPGAAEIDLTGDGDFRLDAGLAPSEQTGRVEDGMPTCGYLPGASYCCGREKEFRAIARALADPTTRGYGLWGMGGIGKTALATEAARRNAWQFREGGIVFVDAREIEPPTTPDLLRRALARLAPAARGEDPIAELITRLTAAPGLIVLDNLETLPETEFEALARFVAQIPANGSHVLLTARAPICAIEALPGVTTQLLTSGLHDYDGAWYAHRLAETKGVALLRDDPPRVEAGEVRGLCARLTRRVSGHPLMIEVAVGVARWGQVELDKALDRLTGDLESKLNEMLATGLALVGAKGRRLLALLPLFPDGNFIPEAMEAARVAVERATVSALPTPPARPTLWARLASALGHLFRVPRPSGPNGEPCEDENDADSEEVTSDWVIEGIRQLERGGFLDRNQEADIFTFHETLRDYAEHATPLAPEHRDIAVFSLLNFYSAYIQANSANAEAIDRCIQNALAVMEMAWTTRTEPSHLNSILAGMVNALGFFFQRRGLWQRGDRWSERAISLLRELASGQYDGMVAQALYQRAGLLRSRGQYDEAAEHLRESLRLYEKADHLQGQAASLCMLATIERDQGAPDAARRRLLRSLDICKGLGDLRGQASSLHELADIEYNQGARDKARRLTQESIDICQRIGDLQGQAASLRVLAIIERDEGATSEAQQLIQESNRILEQLGDLYGYAASLRVLASIEHDQGDSSEAARLLHKSNGICERLGDLQGQAASLQQMAIIERDRGAPATARRLLLRCLGIWEHLRDLRSQAAALHELAIVERDQKNSDEARQLWKRSIDLADRLGDVVARATSLLMLAQMEAAEGNGDAALGIVRESVRLFEGIGSPRATMAREVLTLIDASNTARSANPSPFVAELELLVEGTSDAGLKGGLAAIDATLEAAVREAVPSREVIALLARSVACCNIGDVITCDTSLRRAEEALGRVNEAERPVLAELVATCKARRAEATVAGTPQSLRLFNEAMVRLQAREPAEAHRLFEASLPALRQEGDARGEAACLYMIGQSLLALGRIDEARGSFEASLAVSRQEGDARGMAASLLMIAQSLLGLGRAEDARERLQEAQDVAQNLGDESLLDAAQKTAMTAVTMAEEAARSDDDGSER